MTQRDAELMIKGSEVCAYRELLEPAYDPTQPDDTIWTVASDRCYIDGLDQFGPRHTNGEGTPVACPTGITREEADRIRRARGEELP